MKDSFKQAATVQGSPKWEDSVRRQSALYDRGNDIRSEFERDYTRILHCQAYSRLKHKTQVFFAPKNDHICTRMEHVQHVASVATTISKYLGLNAELTKAIALGHDIGHAPFGHFGEECLNSLLKQKEGANAPKKFWHERNSLFFADYIETLSDIIQVSYFKLTHGKRVFKMAPFHHHLEMGGWTGKKWKEKELFALYTFVSAVFAVISFFGVSGRF